MCEREREGERGRERERERAHTCVCVKKRERERGREREREKERASDTSGESFHTQSPEILVSQLATPLPVEKHYRANFSEFLPWGFGRAFNSGIARRVACATVHARMVGGSALAKADLACACRNLCGKVGACTYLCMYIYICIYRWHLYISVNV